MYYTLYYTREKSLNLKIRPQVGSMTPASSASSRRRPGRIRHILSRYLPGSATSRGRRCVGQVSKRTAGCLVQGGRTVRRRTGCRQRSRDRPLQHL